MYLNYYIDKDHKEIADEIAKVKNQKWVITYDNVMPIKKLYSGYRRKTFKLNYSAGGATKQGQEIMIFSDNMYIAKHPLMNNRSQRPQ